MAQNWTAITDEGSDPFVDEAIPEILLRLATLRSSFSGASAPTAPVAGQPFWNTSTSKFYICTNATGPVWSEVSLGAFLAAIAALGTNGLMARTGATTVAARSVTASTGLSVTNGDAVSGNPNVALAVSALTEDATPDTANDFVLAYDVSAAAHKKVKPSNLFSQRAAASQAEMEAASSNTVDATPGVVKFNPGVGKAWLKWNMTGTPAVGGSLGVSSITDTANGDQTVNYSITFSSAEYCATLGWNVPNGGYAVGFYCTDADGAGATYTATTTRIKGEAAGGTNTDYGIVCLSAHGDL